MWIIGALTAAVACVTTWAVTPLVVRAAHRFGVVDLPGPRKIHITPIPRIGGLAVFLGFGVGLVFAAFATGYVTNPEHGRAGYWAALSLAALAALVLGLVDDIYGVSFQWKFLVQVLAAVFLWRAGFRIEVLGIPFVNTVVTLGFWSLPLTVLWIVGVTNAFNLIDGLDGLAAGTALITTTAVAVIAIVGGHVAVSAVGVALVGALAGFLRYNFSPARIFLGDSGSMFLGFSLAVMSIHGSQKNVTAVAVLAPLLIMGYPILDTGFSIMRRLNSLRTDAGGRGGLGFVIRNAHRVFLPDRGHLHHQLLDLGFSQRTAVLLLYACALAMALGALALVIMNSLQIALLLAISLTALTLAFFVFVMVRSRLARDDKERRLKAAEPPSPRPAASGGSLGRH
jgi:UDP-GlcNAc:undecaprenyl-phosphate/decaprenyl-phosphate GlcNAc-1-phosphate transferase